MYLFVNKDPFLSKHVQVGKDQEKALSEKDRCLLVPLHSRNRGGKNLNQQSGTCTYTMKTYKSFIYSAGEKLPCTVSLADRCTCLVVTIVTHLIILCTISVVTIYFGLDLDVAKVDQSARYIMVTYTVIFVFVQIVFEIYRRCKTVEGTAF